MTDTPPATAAPDASPAPERRAPGIYDWVTTSNHATIGRLWILGALPLLLAALVIGVVLGIERADADAVEVFGGVNEYFRYWTLYRVGLPLLVVAPLFIGLATVVVPLQVGATNIAFPRAALAAFWGWLLGAMIMIVAAIAGGGWGAVDGVTSDEADAIALTLVGMGLVIVSLLLATVCLVTTIVSLRAAGMTLLRVPLFTWSMFVAAGVWLLTLPIAIANLTLIYVDLRSVGPLVFGDPEPSAISIWSQVDWIAAQPQVYAFAIPVLGVIGSVVPVSAGVRQVNHSVMATLIGLFGLLSIGGWAQPAFNPDITEQFVFIVFGLVAAVPVIGVLGGAAATLFDGRDRLAGPPTTALIGALGAVLLLMIGTVSGALRVIEPFELDGRATTTGIFSLVMMASVLGFVAGLWFWSPKVSGSTLPEGLGRFAVLLFLAGAVLLGLADVVSGFLESDDFLVSSPAEDAVEVLNVVSLVGAVLVALGALTVLAAAARAVMPGAAAATDDPWEGHTLEWATASPPLPGNFASPPAPVVSEAPLLDAIEADTDQEQTDGEEA